MADTSLANGRTTRYLKAGGGRICTETLPHCCPHCAIVTGTERKNRPPLCPIPVEGMDITEALLTDRGTNLLSHLMRDLCELLGIKKLNTTAYHPECDGLVERFNRTLKTMIRKHVLGSILTWTIVGIQECTAWRNWRETV